jgi:nucleotide-binding universal stress UspA family protein
LALATRSGHWQIASSRATQKAVRELVAVDAMDRELLKIANVVNQLRRETKRMADALETPEQRRDREINELLAAAAKEKEEKQNANENHTT